MKNALVFGPFFRQISRGQMNKKTDLKIEILSIDQLQEYENNAREHGEIDITAIKDSIEAFGFNDPSIWEVRDNKETAEILQQKLDIIDR